LGIIYGLRIRTD